ncbi:hypothetical protein RUND412_000591 [Rhizina undulata]
MPVLEFTDFNIALAVFGFFLAFIGFFSFYIREKLFIGEALPSVLVGIIVGPIAAKFIVPENFAGGISANSEFKIEEVTMGVCRVVIGVQLVIAGFQLPKQYVKKRIRDLAVALIPVMALMWLFSSVIIKLVIPKVTWLGAMVIGACITSNDPVLSQSVAKGAFADKYVHRRLREIISAEGTTNDGFGFPFLLLAVSLMRHNENDGLVHPVEEDHQIIGKIGDGIETAMMNWFLETWMYFILLGIIYGATVGYLSGKALRVALRHGLIDTESFLLWAVAAGLFVVGTGAMIGTDELLACGIAGIFLNWDGMYLHETMARHDEVNTSIDFLLNLVGFLYIGAIIPWGSFNQPESTGITVPILVGCTILILVFRRIPAMLLCYKAMPATVQTWKEALFMGYFGPIGIGAVFYVEHTKLLLPELGEGDEEENNTVAAMVPVVYFIVLSSILIHGISIPILNLIYNYFNVKTIQDDVTVLHRLSRLEPIPVNARASFRNTNSIVAFNRFARPESDAEFLPHSVSEVTLVGAGHTYQDVETGVRKDLPAVTLTQAPAREDDDDIDDYYEKGVHE